MPGKTSALTLAAFAVPIVVLTACTKAPEDTSNPYCEPVVDAGDDFSAVLGTDVVVAPPVDNGLTGGDRVVYNGNPVGCDQKNTVTYLWSFLTVPVGSAIDDGALTDNNSETAIVTGFTPDVTGAYALSLQVCDDVMEADCTAPDVVVVTVTPGDAVPIADAGPAQSAKLDEKVDLDGSGSYDPDSEETVLEYSWSLVEGSVIDCDTSATMYNSTTATPSMLCKCEGTYVATLVVWDGNWWSAPDQTTITCRSGNAEPIADAGDSGALSPCTDLTIELDGFGSYDEDGDELEYSWSLVSAPSGSTATDASFDDASLANPNFTWDIPGDYSFQLQVFDGESWSAPDIVIYTMRDVSENTGPVANAGEAQSTDQESECSTSSYVWTCDDCRSVEFDLDGSQSYDADGDSLTYFWSEPSNTANIAAPFSAISVVETPTVSATYGTVTTHTFDFTLSVADCAATDEDIVQISVNCEGTF